MNRRSLSFAKGFATAALLIGVVVGLVVGGAGFAQPSKVIVIDDRGHEIEINRPVERIVVAGTPLFTEIMLDLGVGDRIVGVADSPNNPEDVLDLPSVGSTFQPNVEEIIALEPDVVFGAIFDARDQLESAGIVVVTPVFFITGLPDLFKVIQDVGLVVDEVVRAQFLIGEISQDVVEIESVVAQESRPSVAFLFAFSAEDPPFTAVKGSAEGELIARAGGVNILGDASNDAPVSFETIIDRNPTYIFTDISQVENITSNPLLAGVDAVINGRVVGLTTSSLTSTRVALALREMASALHPDLFE